MQLSLQNFSTLVDTMAATVQGACSSLIDLTVGSVLRALLEASASVALWLQYLLLQVLTMTRLATSVGVDADSWVQDFGLDRLPATAASGQVTLSSFNPASQAAIVPNGATVRTSDGAQSFVVVGGPYTRALGVPSVNVGVEALTPGLDGNVQSGVITTLGTAIPGIDTVFNANAFVGGTAAETDGALRLRFISYINTRSQATEQALAYAIASVQQGLTYSIQENVTTDGTAVPGHVHVIIDDGSGHPVASILAAVAAAIDPVRPVGTSISVSPPTLLSVTINVDLTINSSANSVSIQAEVETLLTNYVNALGVGQILRFSRLPGLCYDADNSITNVQSLTVNNMTLDVGGQTGSVVRIGTVNVTVSSE